MTFKHKLDTLIVAMAIGIVTSFAIIAFKIYTEQKPMIDAAETPHLVNNNVVTIGYK